MEESHPLIIKGSTSSKRSQCSHSHEHQGHDHADADGHEHYGSHHEHSIGTFGSYALIINNLVGMTNIFL